MDKESKKINRKESRRKRYEYLKECDRRTSQVNKRLEGKVFNEHINLEGITEEMDRIDKVRYDMAVEFCKANQERIYEYERLKDSGEHVHELDLEEFKIKLMGRKELIYYMQYIGELCKYDIATKDMRIFKMLMNYELLDRYEMIKME